MIKTIIKKCNCFREGLTDCCASRLSEGLDWVHLLLVFHCLLIVIIVSCVYLVFYSKSHFKKYKFFLSDLSSSGGVDE